jgi:hypothetical protein
MPLRKVELTMGEQKKYSVIKRLVDSEGNKHRAAVELGCSKRTINRHIAGYRRLGKEYFSHGNKCVKPANAIPPETRRLIVDLYMAKYYDTNYEFYTELLKKEEGICVSASTVRSILMSEYILSPMCTRSVKKRIKKELEEKRSVSKVKKEIRLIECRLLDIETAHPRRPRCTNFGEQIQMDASVYAWFGETSSQIHAAIDDATGKLVGAYFDWQETLNGYYNVYYQILTRYGIPYKLRTDRRTVFEYKRLDRKNDEDDTFTQFAYAANQLGTHIETTSIPQGKGRIERLFQTLQGRLPVLMRLKGITTIEQANEFLTSYVDEFNAQFALNSDNIPSVFEVQPHLEKINLTLAVIAERTIDNGCCVRFENLYWQPTDGDGNRVLYKPKTKGLVVKAFDGRYFFTVDEQIHALSQVPMKKPSKEFTACNDKPKSKAHIPPMSHPWRRESWKTFKRRQQHTSTLPPAA